MPDPDSEPFTTTFATDFITIVDQTYSMSIRWIFNSDRARADGNNSMLGRINSGADILWKRDSSSGFRFGFLRVERHGFSHPGKVTRDFSRRELRSTDLAFENHNIFTGTRNHG
jgi:hypothetical protein